MCLKRSIVNNFVHKHTLTTILSIFILGTNCAHVCGASPSLGRPNDKLSLG